MLKKILIANRGEIACRIIKSTKKMSIATVAVYSEIDSNNQHVKMADEAYLLGGAAASDSYLCGDKIIEIAIAAGADAIHPGYGFLSENAAFAKKCADAGVIFIGPPASAITAMGLKSEAKTLMEKAKVPLVKGYHGDNQDEGYLAKMADEIGYPVMIKASAGGGGKGMRMVDTAKDFKAALAACKRESINSFGDDKMLIERFITSPRHIEMQIFADNHDNIVHLFERDCSIQRRHQKVLEEAPAVGMTKDIRDKMATAAINAARAIGYQGAGTVEFIVASNGNGDIGDFFFMEMNTRLQVEHPVSEMITNQDLVEWQIRVASGEKLPLTQDQITANGHAIEIRLYAEDPDNDFLPSSGRLHHFSTPNETRNIRVDSAVIEGDEVSVYYDPMIAKIITWGETRDTALRHMIMALTDTHIAGLNCNRDFLLRILNHDAFAKAKLGTDFIENFKDDILQKNADVGHDILAMAAIAVIQTQQQQILSAARKSNDPYSPWNMVNSWRINDRAHLDITINDDVKDTLVRCYQQNDSYSLIISSNEKSIDNIEIDNIEIDIILKNYDDGYIKAELNGKTIAANVIITDNNVTVTMDMRTKILKIIDPMDNADQIIVNDNNLTAPMPGKITMLHAKAGDKVKQGQPLLILEAMKMEHSIIAPKDGVISEILYAKGDQVEDGAQLVCFIDNE